MEPALEHRRQPKRILAEIVISAFPHIEKIRFVSSGTEATMSAIRLARAYTRRKYIVKFEGCYHGHADALLVKAGSGVATLGIPGSAGVPEEFTQLTLALPFNDVRRAGTGFREIQASDRLRDRRAGRRQHGMRAARLRISRGAARDHPARRSVADFRRSDDRFSPGVRRCAGALRNSLPT